jgi:hypothetical protein
MMERRLQSASSTRVVRGLLGRRGLPLSRKAREETRRKREFRRTEDGVSVGVEDMER